MIPALIWFLATLGLFALLLWILHDVEFNRRFESVLYRLPPHDLKDPDYQEILRDVPYFSVKRARAKYTVLSFVVVVVGAGFLACHEDFRQFFKNITPPALFSYLEWAAHRPRADFLWARSESYFYFSLLLLVYFHALPLVLVVSRLSKPATAAEPPSSDAVVKFITLPFLVQQYVLEWILARLLHFPAESALKGLGRAAPGSLTWAVMARLAGVMAEELPMPTIRREFHAMLVEKGAIGVGGGAAAAVGGSVGEEDARTMVIRLIESYGIPDVRRRLEWRTRRDGLRVKLTEGAAAIVGTEEVPHAWMVNAGGDSRARTWSSLLIRIPERIAEVEAAAQIGGQILVKRIGGRDLRGGPLSCMIARRNRGTTEEGCENLFVGAVVQNHDAGRFSKVVRRIRPKQ